MNFGDVIGADFVAVERCKAMGGNVGPAVTHQILDIISMITGMP